MNKLVLCLSLIFLPLIGCNGSPMLANEKSVNIPTTAVDNQHRVGFCWAYTTTGFIESIYKTKTGSDVNLSEEAIGFYRIAEELAGIASSSTSVKNIINDLSYRELQGLHIQDFSYDSKVTKSTRREPRAFSMVSLYGVVPESEYSVKFVDDTRRDKTFESIKKRFAELAQKTESEGKPLYTLTAEKIINEGVLSGPDSYFEKAPPTVLTIGGQKMSPQQYLHNVLGVHPNQYTQTFPLTYDSLVSSIKMALAKGVPVPLHFPVSWQNLHKSESGAVFDVTSAEATKGPVTAESQVTTSTSYQQSIKLDGYHAVIITDFVNNGGQEGALSKEKFREAVAAPAKILSYLKVKNSWGIDVQANEFGVMVGSNDGFYKITRRYIQATLSSGGSWGGVVPTNLK